MKYYLLILLFWCAGAAAQNFDMEKDTIQMKEMVVNNKKQKPKHTSYKFRRGICTFHSGLSSYYDTATMAYNMPKGVLKTLRFEFNHPAPGEDRTRYVDTDIEVSFYDVDTDGNPGNKMASKLVLVPGSHSGKMDIDVSGLGVKNENGIYIALRKIKKENEKATGLEVDCSCKANKNHKTVIYNTKSKKWLPAHGPYAFELTVTIEQ